MPVELVYASSIMERVLKLAQQYARSSATVLLVGESGTGKEVIARFIHEQSLRAAAPYLSTNCAALSESLIESELFGHEHGAFTGAVAARIGLFEAAHEGTLLLDEITEIPVRIQAKLLRVLEQSQFVRVGTNHSQHVDVRIVATTNRCPETEVEQQKLRADLYHRLNVLRIDIPPLRERLDDVGPLAMAFVREFSDDAPFELRLDESALKRLRQFDWPGNVRQLRNVIRRACILARQPLIEGRHLPKIEALNTEASDAPRFDALRLDEIEREVILSRLERFEGNKQATAEALGVSPRTLSNKLLRYRRLGLMQRKAG